MKNAADSFQKLIEIIKQLRDPEKGCPWDKEQDHKSLKPYLIEECYETLDAIDSEDPSQLCSELGDVLLQVVLHSQVASDSGQKAFNIENVCSTLSEKLIRRHPHVFGDAVAENSKRVLENWEKIKKTEKDKKDGTLSGVPGHLPGLLKAQRLGEKTARVGFDWNNAVSVKDKIEEELAELEEAGSDKEKQLEEFGDLLFTLVQWARHQKIDAEDALRQACSKFISRFSKMEKITPEPLENLSMEEKEALWQKAKNM